MGEGESRESCAQRHLQRFGLIATSLPLPLSPLWLDDREGSPQRTAEAESLGSMKVRSIKIN